MQALRKNDLLSLFKHNLIVTFECSLNVLKQLVTFKNYQTNIQKKKKIRK